MVLVLDRDSTVFGEQVSERLDWARLASYVASEAYKRGVSTPFAFARATGMAPKTARKLYKGVPVRQDTLNAVQAWFDWPPGTVAAILRGDPIEPLPVPSQSAPPVIALRDIEERALWDTLLTIALTPEERYEKLIEFRDRRGPMSTGTDM